MSNLHFKGSHQSCPKTLNANSWYKPKPAHKIFTRESYSPGLQKMIKYNLPLPASILPVTPTALKMHAAHSSTLEFLGHEHGARV